MKKPLEFNKLQPVLSSSQNILIALSSKIDSDRVAAGLALHLVLKKTKEVSLFCSKPMTVEFSSLVGVDRIKQKLAGKNLTVSFDYTEGSIEKVSYNIEGNRFNLLIQPKKGFAPLGKDNIEYRYSGEQPDLIFVIGARSLPDLGELYFQNKKTFEQTQLVNFDIGLQNQHFGKLNLIDAEASSFSELMVLMVGSLGLELGVDAASNLLAGIRSATDGFLMSKSGAMSFEAAGICLRAGARANGEQPKMPLKPMSSGVSAKKAPAPSPDWLEPKIYKGNSLI